MCLFLFGLSKRCWLYTYCIRYPTLRRQRFKDSRIRSIRNGYRRMCESQSIIASPFAKCYMSNVTAANTYTVSFKFLQGRVTFYWPSSQFVVPISNATVAQLVINSNSNDPHPFHLYVHPTLGSIPRFYTDWFVGTGMPFVLWELVLVYILSART
jgi:hypothetical protein